MLLAVVEITTDFARFARAFELLWNMASLLSHPVDDPLPPAGLDAPLLVDGVPERMLCADSSE